MARGRKCGNLYELLGAGEIKAIEMQSGGRVESDAVRFAPGYVEFERGISVWHVVTRARVSTNTIVA